MNFFAVIISGQAHQGNTASDQAGHGMLGIVSKPFRAICSFLSFSTAHCVPFLACGQYPAPGFLRKIRSWRGRRDCISENGLNWNQATAWPWSLPGTATRDPASLSERTARILQCSPACSYQNKATYCIPLDRQEKKPRKSGKRGCHQTEPDSPGGVQLYTLASRIFCGREILPSLRRTEYMGELPFLTVPLFTPKFK